MPKFQISRSITIRATPKQVYERLVDFRQWVRWSPWLIADPECQLEFAEDGGSYRWDGKIVGSGEVRRGKAIASQSIQCDLIFHKPFPARNQTGFELRPDSSAPQCTEVTWTLTGSLPFFMFWMKRNMETFVGDDFERGLVQLKDLVETGQRNFEIVIQGIKAVPGFTWLGIRTCCGKAEMGFKISQDHFTLKSWMIHNGVKAAGAPIAIYNKWNIQKRQFDYTAAVQVETIPSTLPSGFLVGTVPAMQAYCIHMAGSYRFLPNAWVCGVMHERAKRYVKSKQHPPFEQFENRPDLVDDTKLQVHLYFPCKR